MVDIRDFFGKKKVSSSKKTKKVSPTEENNKSKQKKQTKQVSAADFFASPPKKKKPSNDATANQQQAAKPRSPSKRRQSSLTKQDVYSSSDPFSSSDNEDDVAVSPPKKKLQTTKLSAITIKEQEDTKPSSNASTPNLQEASPSSNNNKKKRSSSPPPDQPPPKKKASPKAKAAATKKAAAKTKKEKPSLPKMAPLDHFDMDTASPQCLDQMTFCLTGVLERTDISRNTLEEQIKTLNGRVTTAVSSKTDVLVLCGDTLEDGRPVEQGKKYQRAILERTHLIRGVPELYGLFQYKSEQAKKQAVKEPPKAPSTTTTAQNGVATLPTASAAAAKPVANPYAKKTNPYAKKTNPYAKKTKSSSEPDSKPAATPPQYGPNSLWVDKYQPNSSRDILGNQEAVRKLSLWLKTWEGRFNKGKVKSLLTNPQGPWKAALLSGPPGIVSHVRYFVQTLVLFFIHFSCSHGPQGKTTTATLVAKEAGRDLLEYNASDVRSKKAIQTVIGDITGSNTLSFSTTKHTKRCIIMDEVDGMGAGDRSGVAELIQMIKRSKVPIICICNDRQSQKLKSLIPYCMDLRYRRPVKSVIARRAIAIAQAEGLRVEQNAVEAIIESCGNDIRQVVNCLQMWSSKQGNLTYKNLKEREHSINKDEILRVSLFDATRIIVEGRKGLVNADFSAERSHLYRRLDSFFVDYNFIGLLVQENYLKVLQGRFNESKRTGNSHSLVQNLDEMHQAAASMSDFALVEHTLRGENNWGLLSTTALLAVKTGYHAGGESGGFLPGFPEFTKWLGKNSSRGKKERLIGELSHHMNYKVSGGTTELRLSYLPVMRRRMFDLINASHVEPAIEMMDEYGLDRDDIFEKLDEFKMDDTDSFERMDSKKKAAFTRTYNQGSHKSQALVAEQGAAKKPKRKAGASMATKDPDAIDDDNNNAEESEEDEQEEDQEKIRAMFAKKKRGKKKATKASAKPKAKKSRKKK